ncbi:suppressor of fused homolog isoform X3 [Octopus sinensis]|uniref:Suppressor of fused homolog isoform X3 n=1 Tax=Octopus sinensis TaxID=2607531 RepID=A0A7E6FLY8_9MOLL|nr:suppressor of fused homolog isoform X3 [Octopus sinensis]
MKQQQWPAEVTCREGVVCIKLQQAYVPSLFILLYKERSNLRKTTEYTYIYTYYICMFIVGEMEQRTNTAEMDTEKDNVDNRYVLDPHYDGLLAIDTACSQLYPDQPSPLQAAALQKFWLGGPDPLDYISIYSNNGKPEDNSIPAHWHYVTYGFSDLYGDNRVHQFTGPGKLSGFGFELTLRLKKKGNESNPPMWPAALLNKLATYVFQTGNILDVGDHIPWHKSMDDNPRSKSTIRHMLITEDPELTLLNTQYGTLEFRQVLGVTDDEMKSAQHWQGAGILELLKESKGVGSYFITDLDREKSLFEENPDLIKFVSEGIKNDGSNLGHVTAVCCWAEIIKREEDSCDENKAAKNMKEECETKLTRKKGDGEEEEQEEEKEEEQEQEEEGEEEENKETSEPIQVIKEVQLMFDVEAAELLPIVVKGRLKKGRFFVFHSGDEHVIHLVPSLSSQEHIFVSEEEPIKAEGAYLQGMPELPIVFQFKNPNIFITITDCIETVKEDGVEKEPEEQQQQKEEDKPNNEMSRQTEDC